MTLEAVDKDTIDLLVVLEFMENLEGVSCGDLSGLDQVSEAGIISSLAPCKPNHISTHRGTCWTR